MTDFTNFRNGGNVQYTRVTPTERAFATIVACMSYIAAALFVAFIFSLFLNGITVTEIPL